MSRPLRLLFTVSLAAFFLGLAGCKTGTVYDRMYSPKKNYYTPPAEPKGKLSAEELLGPAEPAPDATPGGLPTDALPPSDPGAIPSLPPSAMPDPGMAPAPADPGMTPGF